MATENIDMLAYVNTKFVYVENYLRKKLTTLYTDIIKHKCELERRLFMISLIIANSQPDEFAFMITKGPGYMALTAGEVLYLVKCAGVSVTRIEAKIHL